MISKGNHVKFARFSVARRQWRSKNMYLISSVQCIIKQLLDSVFVISRIIEVSVRVITKTSSNNCLLSASLVLSVCRACFFKRFTLPEVFFFKCTGTMSISIQWLLNRARREETMEPFTWEISTIDEWTYLHVYPCAYNVAIKKMPLFELHLKYLMILIKFQV